MRRKPSARKRSDWAAVRYSTFNSAITMNASDYARLIQMGRDIKFREVHLPAWRAGFAEAGALMTEACGSTIVGEVTHGSEYILTEILRGELGFRGVVISEGDGFGTLVKEHIVETQKEAAALAIRAGVDVGITWESAYLDGLSNSVKDGSVPMELVDRAVRRVLALKFKLGFLGAGLERIKVDTSPCQCNYEGVSLVCQGTCTLTGVTELPLVL
jgi:beta-glucosidase